MVAEYDIHPTLTNVQAAQIALAVTLMAMDDNLCAHCAKQIIERLIASLPGELQDELNTALADIKRHLSLCAASGR